MKREDIVERKEQNMKRTLIEENEFFAGKIIVATGKLKNYTRNQIQDKLISLGARVGSVVSKNTDYLIVGAKAGSKLQKARQLGVQILTESQFEEMIT